MNKNKRTLLQGIIGLIPIISLLAIWNKLPEIVPTHFDSKGVANDFNSKFYLLGILLFLYVISIGLSWLLNNIHKLDPKKRFAEDAPIMTKLSWIMIVFMTAISIFIVYETYSYTKTNSITFSIKQPLILISILFAVLGNFMNNIKPNYFFGIRTPWALEDEENWRKTHHFSSKLWFFGGIILTALLFILPSENAHSIFIGGIIPLATIPFIYSFFIYKKKQKVTSESAD